MAKNLVIVESPAKARTIHKILGADFDVTSSMGHLRDLPTSRLGVDVERDFAPHYIVIQKRRRIAKQLQEQARGREAIYVAPDPDREGEAISWHLERLLLDDAEAQAKKTALRKTTPKGAARKTGTAAQVKRDGLSAVARRQAGAGRPAGIHARPRAGPGAGAGVAVPPTQRSRQRNRRAVSAQADDLMGRGRPPRRATDPRHPGGQSHGTVGRWQDLCPAD